jgi:S1-C subfamily serine protease
MIPRIARALALSLPLVGCAALPPAFARDALDQLQARIIEVSERVKPSVVHIEAVVKVNNARRVVTGTGFVMSGEGVVLTNEHVVERAEKVSILVPGRAGRYAAEVVGTDKQTDLAVVRVRPREGEDPFPVAELGDSEQLQVGEWVIAIGNPYGLEGTVSLGIVSAKGRDLRSEGLLNDFIQTDAMIDRGSSGGPLVNLRGQVIGINSRGQGRGIGFTIPIDTAKRVAQDLLVDGGIARGYLGVSIQPLERELAEYWKLDGVDGVIVNGVVEGSPAQSAGLAVGDVILRFGDEAIHGEKEEDLGQFQRLIAMADVGKRVEIEVLRGGERKKLVATLGPQPKVVPDEEETPFGFTVQEVTDNLFRLHRLDSRRGVLVSFVERGSEAAEAEMTEGDLIERIDERPVVDIASFREALGAVDRTRAFLVRARRGPDTRFLLIVPRKPEGATGAREKENPGQS